MTFAPSNLSRWTERVINLRMSMIVNTLISESGSLAFKREALHFTLYKVTSRESDRWQTIFKPLPSSHLHLFSLHTHTSPTHIANKTSWTSAVIINRLHARPDIYNHWLSSSHCFNNLLHRSHKIKVAFAPNFSPSIEGVFDSRISMIVSTSMGESGSLKFKREALHFTWY